MPLGSQPAIQGDADMGTIPASSHGNNNRGLEAGADPSVGFGRYGRMFDAPAAGELPVDALKAIATAMIKEDAGKPITATETVDENPTIPAGYAYFWQFIDHDITFDPTPFGASAVDVSALVDFRSPALDLDNVYGRGPDDQPYMYDGLTLRVGAAVTAADALRGTQNDLLRLPPAAGPPGFLFAQRQPAAVSVAGGVRLHGSGVGLRLRAEGRCGTGTTRPAWRVEAVRIAWIGEFIDAAAVPRP